MTKNREPKNVSHIFKRNVPGITDILLNKTIGIAGLGGLGSNVAVSLVRSGVGKLIIADYDRVEPSNLNRQFYFLGDIGKKKTDALSVYLKGINPGVILETIYLKLSRSNVCEIFKNTDLLIEAFDKAEEKAWLIETWNDCFPTKPIIVASGLAGYGKTEMLTIERSGNIYICGDGKSESSIGLNAARVAIVANMQANKAIEILVNSN
jgi:sulfur carrier protein ThiS adenylyltransferase